VGKKFDDGIPDIGGGTFDFRVKILDRGGLSKKDLDLDEAGCVGVVERFDFLDFDFLSETVEFTLVWRGFDKGDLMGELGAGEGLEGEGGLERGTGDSENLRVWGVSTGGGE
jgi:hypothetical protein